MTPIRKQRLLLAGLVLSAAAISGTLLLFALQSSVTYLYTPSEVRAGTVPLDAPFRIGGVVQEGSVERTTGTMEMRFLVTDRVHDYPVRYTGILPDLFREGQSVIARGSVENGEFVADEVLAKHDETYMPPEVEAKIREAKEAAARNATASEPATDANGG